MGVVVAVGEWQRVQGWALAGVAVVAAEGPDEIRQAWRSLPPRTALVLLTPAAAEVLSGELEPGGLPLTAVMPR